MKTPKQLVRYFGSQTKAAEELGYTRAAVSLWVKHGKLPRNVVKHFESYMMAWKRANAIAQGREPQRGEASLGADGYATEGKK